jgi:hypothetical protein
MLMRFVLYWLPSISYFCLMQGLMRMPPSTSRIASKQRPLRDRPVCVSGSINVT